jgi:transcriptional regulator with XRE-family HTH domain
MAGNMVPNRVKDLRELRGISKKELCRLAPVSPRELTLIERGHTPKIDTARRIMKVLGSNSLDAIFPCPEQTVQCGLDALVAGKRRTNPGAVVELEK